MLTQFQKIESSFEVWKLEIQSLKKSNIFLEYLITQSIRNSLKPPARNTLLTLEPLASSDEILVKLDNVFGKVASWQSILQEFYTAVQQPEESVKMWSLRLEEILQRVAQKTVFPAEQKNEMLRGMILMISIKYWSSKCDSSSLSPNKRI